MPKLKERLLVLTFYKIFLFTIIFIYLPSIVKSNYLDDIINAPSNTNKSTETINTKKVFKNDIDKTVKKSKKILKADRAGWRRLFTGEDCITINKLNKLCKKQDKKRQRQCFDTIKIIDKSIEKDYSCVDIWKLDERTRNVLLWQLKKFNLI